MTNNETYIKSTQSLAERLGLRTFYTLMPVLRTKMHQ